MLAGVAFAVACRGPAQPAAGRFVGSLARVQLDTVDVAISLTARHCSDSTPPGLVLEGVDRGSGLLIWISDGGAERAYPIYDPGDSVVSTHARVVLYYRTGDNPHTLVLDSGTVRMRWQPGAVSGDLAGSGHEPAAGFRPRLAGSFAEVPVDRDAVPCRTGS